MVRAPLFDPTDQDAPVDRWQRYDWRLLVNSHVHRCPDAGSLRAATGELVGLGYQVHHLDAAHWSGPEGLHQELASALCFPEHYGRNLDALADMLRDVAEFARGSRADSTGTVVAIEGFDRLVRAERGFAEGLLDVFAGAARFGALLGHPMLLLVESGASDLGPVGCTPVCVAAAP